jgi:hypothetical protein
MKKNIIRKILVCGIVVLFFGASAIFSIGKTITNEQQTITKDINKPSEEVLNQFYLFMEKQENVKINPLMKKLIKQAVTSNDDGKILPGFYKFDPCDPINIQGVGTISKNESTVVIYLHDGTANLNNTFNGQFIEWEIAALGTFINFSGTCDGSNEYPFKPLNMTGSSEYALFIESSFMLEMSIAKEKYKRGVEIPINIKRLVFPFMKLRDIELINPHFYVLKLNEETEELNIIYEKILQETWELPLLGTKTWNWDQKDKYGNQVPDGNYSFIGEFEIDGIVHPIFGPGVEIVEKIGKNRNHQMLFNQILEKLLVAFPLLRQLLQQLKL